MKKSGVSPTSYQNLRNIAYKLAQAGVYRSVDIAMKYLLTKTEVNKSVKKSKGRPSNAKYKKRGKRRTTNKQICKQIREIRQLAESDTGTHIYRHIATAIFNSSVGQMSISSISGIKKSTIEEALAHLRYYDPSNPGALITASGAVGSYSKEFLFKKMYCRYTVRNNYQVPCKVTLYIVKPKDATSITPAQAFVNGLADLGNPSSTSTAVYLTDSTQFNDLWTIASSKSKTLYAGQEMVISHSAKPFKYDPSTYDSHGLDYNKGFNAFTIVVRVEGVMGHDTVQAQVNQLEASVDLEEYRLFEIKYNAGADIKTIYINDIRPANFTNSGVVSNNPVVDNQGYSQN